MCKTPTPCRAKRRQLPFCHGNASHPDPVTQPTTFNARSTAEDCSSPLTTDLWALPVPRIPSVSTVRTSISKTAFCRAAIREPDPRNEPWRDQHARRGLQRAGMPGVCVQLIQHDHPIPPFWQDNLQRGDRTKQGEQVFLCSGADFSESLSNLLNGYLVSPAAPCELVGQTYRTPRPTSECSLARIAPVPEQTIGGHRHACRDQNMFFADFIIQVFHNPEVCCTLPRLPTGRPRR